VLPSFDAYYGPFERGGPPLARHLLRCRARYAAPYEEVRRDLSDTGGPVEAEAEYRIASARR
jgi:hypothetical protein